MLRRTGALLAPVAQWLRLRRGSCPHSVPYSSLGRQDLAHISLDCWPGLLPGHSHFTLQNRANCPLSFLRSHCKGWSEPGPGGWRNPFGESDSEKEVIILLNLLESFQDIFQAGQGFNLSLLPSLLPGNPCAQHST